MAKEKFLSQRSAQACQTLIDEGASKKDVAKAVGMTPQTLNRKLERAELERYRTQESQQDGNIRTFPESKRKQA
jgi:IS30 family transposase